MTYQAASGAGAKNMRELISGMGAIRAKWQTSLPTLPARFSTSTAKCPISCAAKTSKANFGVPLAGSLIPWIDVDLGNGQSKEEWKGGVETNKILGRSDNPTVIDGVRTHRLYAMPRQALTLKLKKDLPVSKSSHLGRCKRLVKVIPTKKEASIHELTPAKVTGRCLFPIGRIRKLEMGGEYI